MMLSACSGIFLFVLSSSLSRCIADQDCPECMSFTCSKIPCSPGQLCIMTSGTCVADPCPKLPQCFIKASVCNGNSPLLDPENEVVTCEENGEPCNAPYSCDDGVCCPILAPVVPNVVVDPIPKEDQPDTTKLGEGMSPGIIDVLQTIGDSGKGCKPCEFPLCESALCPSHEDAVCVKDNCSCMFWFEDRSGKHIDCQQTKTGGHEEPDLPMIPGLHFEDPATTPVQSSEYAVQTTTSAGQEGVHDDQADDAWKYGIIAACAAIVLVVLIFVAYKLIMSRRESQTGGSTTAKEQKVPLKEVVATNGDNNNEVKSNQTLLKSQGNETATSSTSGVDA